LNDIGFSVANADGIFEIPFIDRMGFVFIICVIGMVIISLYETKKGIIPNALEIDKKMFRVSPAFMVGTIIIVAVLAALYSFFW